MIRNIRIYIHQANMRCDFTSTDAESYIDWLEPRLNAEYAGAKVAVNYGLSRDLIEADTSEEVRDVECTIRLLWDQFQRERKPESLQTDIKSAPSTRQPGL